MIDSLLENQKQLHRETKELKKKKKRENAVSTKSKSGGSNPKKKSKSLPKPPRSPTSPSSLEEHFQEETSSIVTGCTAPLSPTSAASSAKPDVQKRNTWQLRESLKHEPAPVKTPKSLRKNMLKRSVSTPALTKRASEQAPTMFSMQFTSPIKSPKTPKNTATIKFTRTLRKSLAEDSCPSTPSTVVSEASPPASSSPAAVAMTPRTGKNWKVKQATISSDLPPAFASSTYPVKTPKSIKKKVDSSTSSTTAVAMTPRTVKNWKVKQVVSSDLPPAFASSTSLVKTPKPIKKKVDSSTSSTTAVAMTPRTVKKWKAKQVVSSDLPPAFASLTSLVKTPKSVKKKVDSTATTATTTNGVKKTTKKLKDADDSTTATPKKVKKTLSSKKGLSPVRPKKSSTSSPEGEGSTTSKSATTTATTRLKSLGKLSSSKKATTTHSSPHSVKGTISGNLKKEKVGPADDGKEPSRAEVSASLSALKNRIANRLKEIHEIRDSTTLLEEPPSPSSSTTSNFRSSSKPNPQKLSSSSRRKSESVDSQGSSSRRSRDRSVDSKGSSKSGGSSSSKSSKSAPPQKVGRKPRSLAQPDRLAPWQIREQQKHRITPMVSTGGLYGRRRDDDEDDDDDDIGSKFSLPAGLAAASKKTVVVERKANMLSNPRGTQKTNGNYIGKNERKNINDARNDVKGSILESMGKLAG
jgi:hypothetical protein